VSSQFYESIARADRRIDNNQVRFDKVLFAVIPQVEDDIATIGNLSDRLCQFGFGTKIGDNNDRASIREKPNCPSAASERAKPHYRDALSLMSILHFEIVRRLRCFGE
jgi:hypothetical protein